MNDQARNATASGFGPAAPLFNEEIAVARFVTVAGSDGGFTIPDPTFPISDVHLSDIAAPGIINGLTSVVFFRTTHTGTPTFSIRLNSTQLLQHTFNHGGPHAWHEIISPGALLPAQNELTLFVIPGEGSVRFSDIVFLYTSNQLTVRKPIEAHQ